MVQPSVNDYSDAEEQISEWGQYTVEEFTKLLNTVNQNRIREKNHCQLRKGKRNCTEKYKNS